MTRLRRFLPPYRMIRPKRGAYARITTIEGKRTPPAEYRRFLVWDDGLCRHLLVTFRRPVSGGEWVPVPHPSQTRIAASRSVSS